MALVTGAGGFIGSHLTERLVALGANTRSFIHYNSSQSCGWLEESSANAEVEFFFGDVCDRGSLRDAVEGCTVVFHLAALIGIPYSYRAPHSYVRTNVEGSLNVFELCRELSVEKILHTSTSEVYGSPISIPIAEGHPLQGQSPYSASKIGADKMAEALHLSLDLPVVTVRPFNTFGPRQSARAIIPTIITQALTQDRIRIGSANPTRDFNYVANTVDGFVQAAECNDAVGQTLNLGSGEEISVGELVSIIQRAAGTDVPVEEEADRMRPERSEVTRLCADSDRARKIVNWKPKVSFLEGLASTIKWVQVHLDRYRADIYTI